MCIFTLLCVQRTGSGKRQAIRAAIFLDPAVCVHGAPMCSAVSGTSSVAYAESPDVRQEPDDAPALAFQLQQPPPVTRGVFPIKRPPVLRRAWPYGQYA